MKNKHGQFLILEKFPKLKFNDIDAEKYKNKFECLILSIDAEGLV
jgi:hypothetical protein